MVISLTTLVMLILMGIGMIVLVWGVSIRLRDVGGRYCAARRRGRRLWRWLGLLWPGRLILVRACMYDLSGLHVAADSAVKCPECGVRSRRALRSKRRLRRINIGLMLLLVGAFTPRLAREVNWNGVAERLPVRVLIVLEQRLGPITPLAFRHELRKRFQSAAFDQWETDHFIELLVRDLRADKVWNNGEIATFMLRDVVSLAEPALERALNSDDWQQRQIAADLLRFDPFFQPTDVLFRVTMEGLRQDSLPYDDEQGRYSFVFNARNGTEYLIAHARQAQAQLEAGLQSDDAQQQLLSAAIIGLGGCEALADRAAPVLIEHLKNNGIADDAIMATRALAGLGPLAMSLLMQVRDSPDRQQRGLVRLILARLAAPEDQELTPREIQIRITERTDDPTTLSIEYLNLPDIER